MTGRKNIKKQSGTTAKHRIQVFSNQVDSLVKRGYVCLGPANVCEIPTATTSTEQLSSSNCIGGAAIQGSFSIFDSKQSNPQPVSNAGTQGLGYIPWGPDNRLPNTIYNLASSLPYTASALDYIVRITAGLGPQLMYRWVRYSNGTVVTELIPFEDAGVLIRNRIREVRAEIAQNPTQTDESQGADILFTQAMSNMQKPSSEEEDEEDDDEDFESIGTPEDELKRLKEDYRTWKRTNKEWKEFTESNNLNLHFLQCLQDDTHLDMYFPTIGLSIGRKGEEWKPKIVKIGYLPAVCTRMEEMDSRLRVNYVYYSEKWRKDATPKLENRDVVAYPTLMPQNMLPELRRKVEKNKLRSPRLRPTWFCCPSFYPSMQKPYYPQPVWWSIFTSRTYDYASTLITDKANARQNATMWGKMIFINNEYLRAMFDAKGAETPEDQELIRNDIYKRMNDFLQRRENNGKTICLDMFVGPDGKTMQHAVEIVDVPQVSNSKEMKDELEEISSIIFFAIGVHPALIGAVPGKSSSGGTYQRELSLLKQNQVSPRQRIYLRFMNNIYAFNEWDPHGEIVIRQQVLTTLDRNAGGTEDTESQK